MAQTFDYQNENQAVAYDDNIYHVINNVKYLFERQEKQLEFWKSRAQEVEDEKWRDKTLQQLAIERDNAIQDLRRGFGITEEEKKIFKFGQISIQLPSIMGSGAILIYLSTNLRLHLQG